MEKRQNKYKKIIVLNEFHVIKFNWLNYLMQSKILIIYIQMYEYNFIYMDFHDS